MLLGPFLPAIELTARLRSATRHHHGTDVFLLEHAELGVLKELLELGNRVVETQVRLIGAVFGHRFLIGHAADRGLDLNADELPQFLHDRFTQSDDVFLFNERRLNVELRELWLAVCTEVFVAVAASELVVTLNATDLQKLLEQLRRLRQRVPLTWRKSRRNDEVACTFRGRTRHRRGLDLEEVAFFKHTTCGFVGLGTQTQVCGWLWTAQIEIAVLEAGLFTDLDVLVNLERQRSSGVQDLEAVGVNFDLTRCEVRVLRTLWARLDLTRDLDDELVTQRGERCLIVHHDLRDARGVTQIEESDTAVVTATSNPTCERYGLPHERGVEGTGVMSTEHGDEILSAVRPAHMVRA